jgi:restriction system protein
MADVKRRRIGELVQGVLRVVKDKPNGMRPREVFAALEQIVPPTPSENTPYKSRPDVRRYDQIVRFATIQPVKAGWIVKAKGRWMVTDAGRAALTEYPDAERLVRASVGLYQQWKAARGDSEPPEEVAAEVAAEEEAAAQAFDVDTAPAFEDAEGEAWDEIETYATHMDPCDFHALVAALLSAMGYHIAWVAPPGTDQDIDVIAYPDPLGAKEPSVKVSVRRSLTKTDVKDVREFLSLLRRSDLGILVSLYGFTREAEELARLEERKIRLFDLEKIYKLWVEHYGAIAEQHRRLLPLRPVWFLALRPG